MIRGLIAAAAVLALAGPAAAQAAQPSAPADPVARLTWVADQLEVGAGAFAALDDLHAAAARADLQAWSARLHPDLVWIGNETSERWDRDAFVAFAAPLFAEGRGWTYAARERHLDLAPLECQCLAWFEEVLDSETYGVARGDGLLMRGDDGAWRVLRYALTYPIPNDLAGEMTAEIRAFEAQTPVPVAPGEGVAGPEAEAVAAVLDELHRAAAQADGAAYFDLFAPGAVYLGTDVTERWTVDEFRAYAEPHFARGRGWTYTPRDRNVFIVPDECRCVAWFDEVLDSESYGTSRGTGVLLRWEDGPWRIVRYSLTFPIPNALARDMTARIRAAAAPEG